MIQSNRVILPPTAIVPIQKGGSPKNVPYWFRNLVCLDQYQRTARLSRMFRSVPKGMVRLIYRPNRFVRYIP